MAQYLISDTYMTQIANAIRGKLNVTDTYTPGEMSGAINSIPVATAPQLQDKTVTPQEYQQIISADSPNVGLNNVTVSAIPSTYVGSGVATAAANTVTPKSTEQTAIAANTYATGIIKVAAVPEETKTITTNGTYAPPSGKWFSSVTVNIPMGDTIANQNKTVSPSESKQEITADSGYTGLGTVTVNAISKTYVGSSVTRQAAKTITPSTSQQTAVAANVYTTGAITVSAIQTETKSVTTNGTYTPTSGKYFSSVTVNVPTDSTINNQNKTVTPSESKQEITADSGYTGLGTVTVNGISTTFVGSGVTRQAAKTITPSTSEQTAVAAQTYTTGVVKVAAIPSTYIVPSGNKAITANGTDIDVKQYATVSVNVPSSGSTVNNQSKTATPFETQQSITPDSGYTGLSEVTIEAISSTYVGSGIASRSSSDLTASGATVSVPAGYYASAASKAITNGSVTAPSSISGTSATVTTGTNTLTFTKTVSVTPNVTTAGYISAGTAGNASVSLTASVTTKAAATITPSTSNQTIAAGTYLTGAQTISGDSNLVGSNILSGKSIFGVAGTVTFQTYYTGSTAPSSSVGVNGDIYLQTGG